MTQVQCTPRFFGRAYETILAFGIGVLAFTLVFPTTLHVPFSIVLAGMSALLVGISVNDFRTRRVPNWVTYPLMLVGVARAFAQGDGTFLFYWVALFSLWQTHFIGGGDAKLLMGFFGLFPDFQFAWITALSILFTGIPYLLYKYRRQWRSVPRAVFFRLITRQILPSQNEFEKEAVPFAFSFCLACGAYLLLRVTSG